MVQACFGCDIDHMAFLFLLYYFDLPIPPLSPLSPPKVTPKRPPDSGSDGEGRRLPKLKIAVGAVAKKSQQRLSMGSVSEYDDMQM